MCFLREFLFQNVAETTFITQVFITEMPQYIYLWSPTYLATERDKLMTRFFSCLPHHPPLFLLLSVLEYLDRFTLQQIAND